MRRWAERLLVPKVLVANQTRVIEAVADPDGAWLPAVPVVTVRPAPDGVAVDDIAAVLTSPVASVWAWHRAAGTGLSARSLRLGPRLIEAAAVAGRVRSTAPWPACAPATWPAAVRPSTRRTASRARELASWWQAALPGAASRAAGTIAQGGLAARLAVVIRRRLPALLLVGALALGVAGCGGDDERGCECPVGQRRGRRRWGRRRRRAARRATGQGPRLPVVPQARGRRHRADVGRAVRLDRDARRRLDGRRRRRLPAPLDRGPVGAEGRGVRRGDAADRPRPRRDRRPRRLHPLARRTGRSGHHDQRGAGATTTSSAVGGTTTTGVP